MRGTVEATDLPDLDLGLMSLQEFANRYHVQTSVIRWWIKKGYVKATLIGSRQIKMIYPPDVIAEVVPVGAPIGDFEPYPFSPIYMRMPANADRERDAAEVHARGKVKRAR